MDKIRNTLTYRFSVLAGIYIIIAAIIYKWMSMSSAAVFWTAMLIPLFFTTGLGFLIMDLVKPFRFEKQLFKNKFITAAEIILILVYTAVSICTVIEMLLPPDMDFTEYLLIYAITGFSAALSVRGIIYFIIKFISPKT